MAGTDAADAASDAADAVEATALAYATDIMSMCREAQEPHWPGMVAYYC